MISNIPCDILKQVHIDYSVDANPSMLVAYTLADVAKHPYSKYGNEYKHYIDAYTQPWDLYHPESAECACYVLSRLYYYVKSTNIDVDFKLLGVLVAPPDMQHYLACQLRH